MTNPPPTPPADGAQPAAHPLAEDERTPPIVTGPPLVSGPIVLNIPIGVIARRKHGERRGCRKQRYVVVTWRVEIDNDYLVSMANRIYAP